MTDLLWFLLIGLAAGWLAGRITRGRAFGLAGDLIVGGIGALLGGFLFNVMGFVAYGLLARLVMAVVGAVVLLFLLGALRRVPA